MAPHAREAGVVGVAVALAVVVAPEAQGHAGHGRGDHELALLSDHRTAGLVEGLHPGAELAAADLAGHDGHQRAPADEGGAHVGATADRREPDGGELGVHPLGGLVRERRAGRPDRAQRAQVAHAPEGEPGAATRRQERSAGPEDGHAGLGRQAPEGAQIGPTGVAVEQHDGGPDAQTRDQEVPHHPAGRGEPEEAVAGPEVLVEAQGLEVFQQDAAVAVDDGLGGAGGARGEEHVERVVEGNRLEVEGSGLRRQLGPAVVDVDDGGERRQGGHDLVHLGAAVHVLAPVPIAPRHQQDRGVELAEPVDHASGSELGRTRGPHRAQAGRGQEGDHGLRSVREVPHDPIAGSDPEAGQPEPAASDLVAQVVPRQLARSVRLRPGHDGGPGAGGGQCTGGVVESGPGEPSGARHGGPRQHRVVGGGGLDGEEPPDRGPERGKVVDRPAPQLVVVGEPEIELGLEPGQVVPDHRRPANVGGRRPEGPGRLVHRAVPEPAASTARARAATTSSTIWPSKAMVVPPAWAKAARRRRAQSVSSLRGEEGLVGQTDLRRVDARACRRSRGRARRAPRSRTGRGRRSRW